MLRVRVARLLRRWLHPEEPASEDAADDAGATDATDATGPYRRAAVREETDLPGTEVWAAVANVALDTSFLPAEQKRGGRGTRHFAPGSKVFVRKIFRGPGGELAEVVGRHRGSKRYVRMVVRSDCLENARVRIVYSPRVRALLASDEFALTKTRSTAHADAEFLDGLPRPYRP